MDGSLEEKIRVLITCLVVASLLDPAEAHREDGMIFEDVALGSSNWQFLLGLVVVTICCWEVFKVVSHRAFMGCWYIVPRVFNWTGASSDDEPAEQVHVLRYADVVVLLGARDRVAERANRVVEEQTAPEGPGTPPLLKDLQWHRGIAFPASVLASWTLRIGRQC